MTSSLHLQIPITFTSTTHIYSGTDIIKSLPQIWVESLKNRPILLITDHITEALYAKELVPLLEQIAPIVVTYSLVTGEQTKLIASLPSYIDGIVEKLAAEDLYLSRDWVIVGLGGGVVLDIAGFLAAILLRGLSLVLLPTTLMAQIDSSIGGKNGMHSSTAKHILGEFYMPDMVIIEQAYLESQETRQFRSGLAEMIKYAMLGAPNLLPILQATTLHPSDDTLPALITECISYKAKIVGADPFEKEPGGRILLNFGHSFGHALEAYFQFDDTIVTHGEAVAIGMMTSARVAHALGYCALELVGTLEQVLAKHHLPTSLHMLPTFPAFDKLVTAMHHDKKNSHGSLRLLLMHDIGKIEAHHFSADALVTLLESLADNI